MNCNIPAIRSVLLVAMTLGMGPGWAADFYVQQTVGNDANPGDTWGSGHALATIQRALDLAETSPGANVIHVAAGTYPEHLTVDRSITLLGSYPADGGTTRNRTVHPSIVDGSSSGVPISVRGNHVTIDRFIVQNGLNQEAGNGIGGGISVVYVDSITLSQNLVRLNTAISGGGGIGIHGSTQVTLTRNNIQRNHAPSGGGVSVTGGSVAILNDNSLTHNTTHGPGDGLGGGLWASQASLTLSANQIDYNQAHDGGGLALLGCVTADIIGNRVSHNVAAFDGGGLLHYACNASIRRNQIQFNSAGNWGGGICLRTNSQPERLLNNLITDNVADANGGGVSLYDNTSATLVNNTVARNHALGLGGGLYIDGGTSVLVRNSILWANAADSVAPTESTQITNGGQATVRYSDVQGGWPGTGNIGLRPQWVLIDDYHLGASSPCKDTANPSGAPVVDLDGTPRPYGTGFDMGAYEWTPGPDLSGYWSALAVSADGLTLEATFILRNRVADQAAGAFGTAFYVSDDGQNPSGAAFLTVASPAGLAGGASQVVPVQQVFGESVAGKYILSSIDVGRRVREVIELNNTRVQQIPTPD